MVQRPPRQQYAALCYRTKKRGEAEVLVATSRDTGRWVIPKGWPMEHKKAHQVAEQEAFEEVGVKGKAEKAAFGYYHYRKGLDNGIKVPVRVQVHLLKVDDCVKDFKEKGVRRIEWVSAEEAANRVNEPELKILLLQFAETMRKPVQDLAPAGTSPMTAAG
ncbi:NUDIX hydrolase [Neorhizobium sp. NCHU2750]|uniref:NUDIX hydrolase n=1 Tax=Neorhizobium sp. NCHU2750 TaxID=1825976 RepID=UPI000E7563D1